MRWCAKHPLCALYAVFLLASLYFMLSTSFILSSPRYCGVLFPISFLYADLVKNKPLLIVLTVLLFLPLFFIYAHWFSLGRWVF